MVAPSAAGANFDVLLAFSLDEEANKRVQNRTSTIEQELKRIQGQAKKTGAAINESMSNIDTKSKTVKTSVTSLGVEMAKLGARAKQGTKGINEGLDATIKKYKELQNSARQAMTEAGRISGAAARGANIFGRGLASGLILTGGITAEAGRYAKEEETAGRATMATREWTKATEDLARARAKVDNVLLKESLPLIQQAAKVAAKAADFIQKNPEIVRSALKFGAVVAGLSAVGLAVTKGIKLVADAAYIAAVATEFVAAKLHDQAANKELAAATAKTVTNRADDLRNAFGLTKTETAASSIGSLVGVAGLVLAGLVATGVAVKLANDLLDKLGVNDKIDAVRNDQRDRNVKIYPGVIANPAERNLQAQMNKAIDAGDTAEIARLKDAIKNLGKQAGDTADRIDQANMSVANSPAKDAILNAYTDYKNNDLALVQEHYKERQGIVQDALAAEMDANKQYAASVSKINTSTTKSLGSAAADFEKANARAEQQYQDSRAQVIRDGNQEIERIEADSKERLRKLTQDHEDRVADLVAHTNALGLAKENRNFGRDVSDEKRQTTQEIRDRRQAIAQRLADLQQSYEQERAQRQADYQQRVTEIRANAAEQLKELAVQHQEELKRIRDQRVAKLKELDAAFNDERKRRYQYLVQQLKDLDAGLFQVNKLEKAYMDQRIDQIQTIIDQANKMTAAANATTTTTNPGGRASGGYASAGLYRLGEAGREFVLNSSSTQAAEKIIGSQLNQANLVAAIAAYGGNRQMNYVDQRRIDQPVSKWDKRMMEEIAVGAMQKLMR